MFVPIRHRFPALLLFVLLAGAAVLLAINYTQSLWIDEAETAVIAMPATLHGWWTALLIDHTSNLQMPLYMLYIWGWVRFFGASEIALRAANIPWFFVGLFVIFHCLRRHNGLRNVTLLLYCIHPFVLYYVGEARPYLMQLCGALMVTGALFESFDAPEQPGEPFSPRWWWLFGAGITILCGAGMLGAVWAMAFVIFLIWRPGFCRSLARGGVVPLLLFGLILIAMGLYYAWTIVENARPTIHGMTIPSMLAVFYEQLGFMGLGPGRADLRVESIFALQPFLIPFAILALPLGWGLFLAVRRRFGVSRCVFTALLLLALVPVCLIFTFGFLRQVRILGRHLIALFPFILLAEAWTIRILWKEGRRAGRIAVVLIFGCLILSTLDLRFAYRHTKDDYRSAAAFGREALSQDKTVWWVANPQGAMYYGLPISVSDSELPGTALYVAVLPSRITNPPDVIVLTKPDLTDTGGEILQFIAAHRYHLAARFQEFTIFEKQGN